VEVILNVLELVMVELSEQKQSTWLFVAVAWETKTKRLIKMLEIFINLLCNSDIFLHIVQYRCAKTKG
jgi:hypothetical protein